MISRIAGALVEPTPVAVEADADSLAIEGNLAPKKEKAPPASKPTKSGGGKQKKKKWSKGKQKEKRTTWFCLIRLPMTSSFDALQRFKALHSIHLINGSLARKAIKDLMARGAIRMVSAHSSQQIYTRATNT
ncbi:40S ribosomal protein S25 [Tanacetum coccineum]